MRKGKRVCKLRLGSPLLVEYTVLSYAFDWGGRGPETMIDKFGCCGGWRACIR